MISDVNLSLICFCLLRGEKTLFSRIGQFFLTSKIFFFSFVQTAQRLERRSISMSATVRLRLVPVKPVCDLCERHMYFLHLKTKCKQISDIRNNVIYFCDKQKSWKAFSFSPYLKLKKNGLLRRLS